MSETYPNGGPFSTKEMLVRLDSKLDALLARQAATETRQAVFNAELIETRNDVREISQVAQRALAETSNLKLTMRYVAGAIGLVLFLAPFVFTLITR